MLTRRGPALMSWLLLAFAIVWVAIKAFGQGFGISGNGPQFVITALNGVSLAALYFITASGFTLIFGLMRVVNMAHGSLYLLGGYVALDLVNHGMGWWGAMVLAALITGTVGLLVHQALLRWNQGQDLRQALITIAVATILADQMIVHFGATPSSLTPPAELANSIGLGLYHLEYPVFRLFIIGAALVVALVLWLVIRFTRFGMIVRAGVDDRAMTSSLGINVPLVFGGAFFIGAVYGHYGIEGSVTSPQGSGAVRVNSKFLGPQIGARWVQPSGFFAGVDVAWAFPLAYSSTSTPDPSGTTVSIQQTADRYLQHGVPLVGASLGWLF